MFFLVSLKLRKLAFCYVFSCYFFVPLEGMLGYVVFFKHHFFCLFFVFSCFRGFGCFCCLIFSLMCSFIEFCCLSGCLLCPLTRLCVAHSLCFSYPVVRAYVLRWSAQRCAVVLRWFSECCGGPRNVSFSVPHIWLSSRERSWRTQVGSLLTMAAKMLQLTFSRGLAL